MMRTQLKVIKADGSLEEYSHTKVMGTINNALCRIGQADVYIAEQLAEVVTYFLYHRQNRRSATSSEIFSIIKAVLAAVSYDEAAIGLTEHHFERRLKRWLRGSRLQVPMGQVQNSRGSGNKVRPQQTYGKDDCLDGRRTNLQYGYQPCPE